LGASFKPELAENKLYDQKKMNVRKSILDAGKRRVNRTAENSNRAISSDYGLTAGHIYTWSEVSKIHRVRNGIYQRNGRLISLLTDFGRINPCYPDFHGTTQDTIFYTGSGRRGDQTLGPANRALLDAINTDLPVPLFNKLSPGRWEFLGLWQVIDGRYIFDEKQNRMLWKFTLERID
jgi:hypothetical protein